MTDFYNRVSEVIGGYIQQHGTLITMEQIHNQFTGKSEEFSRWEEVEKQYRGMDWDDESFTEFTLTAKNVVEGGIEEISESYFDIITPEDLSKDQVKEELERITLDESASPETRHGVQFREDDGVFRGNYYYSTIDVDITSEGSVDRLVTEKSIPFRIEVDDQLLVAETTYPAYVQKIKGVFGNQTDMSLIVSGDITAIPDQANERLEGFLQALRGE